MRKVFNEIRGLNWKEYPVDELENFFKKFGRFPMMVTEFNEGRLIHRARPVDESEIITSVSGLSYKPQELNSTYQRASTPQQTMLYGAVIPPEIDDEGIDNPRVTSAMESVSFLRNTKLDGTQRVLYGKWRVKSKISLITILFTRYRNAKNNWLKKMSEEFYESIAQYTYPEQKAFKQINNFYSSEFSKFVAEDEDYNYLISALFSLKCTQSGFDGVIYPSVRTMGLGINVAIKPETVDEKLELVSVLDCRLHKKGKLAIINNLRFGNVIEGSETFHLNDISDPNLRFTNTEIENKLGVN
ncbi:MAG: hypothetical protein N4A71_01225 [Carboxylicivirga sp.]|jgi:hypothetical protein|nr:hypothetical protein [Carboxylicivirga sp.]